VLTKLRFLVAVPQVWRVRWLRRGWVRVFFSLKVRKDVAVRLVKRLSILSVDFSMIREGFLIMDFR
jgi:hypothetical protein